MPVSTSETKRNEKTSETNENDETKRKKTMAHQTHARQVLNSDTGKFESNPEAEIPLEVQEQREAARQKKWEKKSGRSRKVELPLGALGLTMKPGSTVVQDVQADSAVASAISAGETVLALQASESPGGKVSCAAFKAEQIEAWLVEHQDAPRTMWIERVPGPGKRNSQLLAAISAGHFKSSAENREVYQDRARELLMSGANANTKEPVYQEHCPLMVLTGALSLVPFFWPFLICCTIPSGALHSKPALHMAMEAGNSSMVELLLESGADRKAGAYFLDCCCCYYTAMSKRGRSILMGGGPYHSEVPPAQQQEITRLLSR